MLFYSIGELSKLEGVISPLTSVITIGGFVITGNEGNDMK